MKNQLKTFVAAIFAIALIVEFCSLGFKYLLPKADAVNEYNVGDTFELGSYPQSKVTDITTLSALNAIQKTYTSYSYMSGDGTTGSMTSSDYMKYCDITYGTDKYRAVTFTSYRPRTVYKTASDNTNLGFQDNNGYTLNTVYYFKFEPIVWKVLDPSTGLAVTEKIINSCPYNDYIYENGSDKFGTAYYNDSAFTAKTNNYTASSVYSNLNGSFYNTAFTADEKSQIALTTNTNNAIAAGYSMYDCDPSDDKVFLLSYSDALNSQYGFTDTTTDTTTRTAVGTDYAKCQGLQVDTNGTSAYLLRSAGEMSRNVTIVDYGGFIKTGAADLTDKGFRPAITTTAVLPESSHTVTLELNGGTCDTTSVTIDYGSAVGNLPTPVRTGYTFNGWYTSVNYDSILSTDTIIKADIKAYAKWTINQYTITFDTDGGTEIAPITQDYGTAITPPSEPTIEHYTFLGWDGIIPTTMPAENITLTAKWELNSHPLVFTLGDGKSNGAQWSDGTSDDIETKVKYEAFISTPDNPSWAGHKFTGWTPTVAETMPDESQTYVAAWDTLAYSITYQTDGGQWANGSTEEKSIIYQFDSIITLHSTPKKTGYLFTGWSPELPERMSAGDIITVAQWTVCTHSNISEVINTPAGCLTEGLMTCTCNDCGYVYTAAIPAAGHKDTDNDGICDVCGEIVDLQKYNLYLARQITVDIRTPSKTDIEYGYTIVLHASLSSTLPDGYSVSWSYEGDGFDTSTSSDGMTFKLKSTSSSQATVTLKLIDASGNTVTDNNGNEIKDAQSLSSKVNFWYKILYFFKHLFKTDLIIDD